ncbi:hypothetical protein [Alkalimonas sp.]|uniref:hypothetical protein n=1 Tax=Alkalimonas sp. TaxID=1872453 RepID=UPI00263B3601|nr:hypothetical protein [Alkalimonas sp.]MCC5824877.1 hypothetical protein [Alkalimonas sp.]
MEEFPIQKIVFTKAKIQGKDGNVSIEVDVAPFELNLDGYAENVDTCIRLDCVRIPRNPVELEGKEFIFPINPVPGYIDGSIYFFAAHNPVDVTKIVFGNIQSKKLPITLETNWVLEYERTGFKNLSKTVVTSIEL